MQMYILCNNLGLLIYGLLFVKMCLCGRIFGKHGYTIRNTQSYTTPTHAKS